jgi:predicted MFS family arabinose efflux permease
MRPFDGITAGPQPTGARAWLVAVVLGTAQLCVLFDSLAVATALPPIGRHFGLGPAQLQWVVSLYSISIGSFMLLGGRCSDAFGARRVLTGALGVCAAGGIVAGCAPSVALLLAGRVAQGVAAAVALPASLSLASSLFPREPWKSRVYAVIATAAWLAALAGAVLGGLITTTWGWRWVFLVTVPAAVVGVLGCRLLPAPLAGDARPRRGLDPWGAALACAGLAALLLGVVRLGAAISGPGVVSIVAALVLLGGFVAVEGRVADPLLPPRLLRSPRLVASCLAFGAYCAGYTGLVVVGSLFVQTEYGLTPAQTGLFLTPTLVVGTASAVLAPAALRRYGTRSVTVTALSLCCVAMTGLALSRPDDLVLLVPWLALWGLASGPVFVGLTREVLGGTDPGESGTVAATFESMSHVGGGVAASGYLTLLGSGLGFAALQLIAAVIVGLGAGVTLWIGRRPGQPQGSAHPAARLALRRSA